MDAPLHEDPAYQAAVLSLLDAGGFTRSAHGPVIDVWFDATHAAVVFHAPSLDPRAFEDAVADLWAARGADVLDAVVVGGDRACFDAACAKRPAYTGQRTLGVSWVTPEGSIEIDRASRRVADALRGTFARGAPPLRGEPAVAARLDEAARVARAQAEELERFQRHLSSRRAPVTWALLGAMGALFAAKWAIGDHGLVTDVRMGALVPWRVAAEPWRLVSHAFLHANGQHILFNGMTLLSLGAFYERLLGPWRFAALFALSAVGGGVAATLAGPGHVMVGASGALWGLLGVSFALALRPGATLPRALQPGFRRNAAANLALQVMVSLLPNVSWQAHLGGGLVGFALMLSGLARPRDDGRGDRVWKALGLLSLALSAAAVVTALASGRPWAR